MSALDLDYDALRQYVGENIPGLLFMTVSGMSGGFMAKLEIELAPEEQRQIQQEAERARLTVEDWIRQRLLHKPAFITDDGEVFEIPDLPDDLGRACAVASEATLQKFWDAPEEDEAWRNM